jgi:hypothetical protein
MTSLMAPGLMRVRVNARAGRDDVINGARINGRTERDDVFYRGQGRINAPPTENVGAPLMASGLMRPTRFFGD